MVRGHALGLFRGGGGSDLRESASPLTINDYLQFIPAGATLLCVHFLKGVYNDFRSFKNKSEAEFLELRKIRQDSIGSMSGFALELGQQVEKLKLLHEQEKAKINDAMKELSYQLTVFVGKADKAQGVFEKALDVAHSLNLRVNKHQEAIQTIKIELGKNAVMYKSKKP